MNKQPVYDQFINGAKDGIMTVFQILPTLIGLMIGVGILRGSGFLDFLANLLVIPAKAMGMPACIIPLIIIRMFSSSAATSLALDIFETYGADSFVGVTTSILMSCTETIFYTMSVYFMAAKVKKTRYTLGGALIATFAGVIASLVLAKLMF